MARKKGAKMSRGHKSHSREREGAEAQEKSRRSPFMNPIVISIIAVYLLIITVYFLNYAPQQMEKKSMEQDRNRIMSSLVSASESPSPVLAGQSGSVVRFIVDDDVDKDKLREFASQNYEAIKESLGIENDFCIHFEDREGNLIDISPITSRRGVGLGSPALEFTLIDTAGAAVGVVTC